MTSAPLSAEALEFALAVAMEAAKKAAHLIDQCIEQRADQPLEIEEKSSSADLVTQYDTMCEEVVLAMLQEKTPTYEIISEETRNDIPMTDGPTWVVDPVDGTTGFVHGSFDCGVSIGLCLNKQPILGVVILPRLGETFHAVVGQGAFRNGKRIHASGCTELTKSIVCTHTAYNRSEASVNSIMDINRELALMRVHAIRSYGSAAMDMCSVACGRLDMYFEVGIQAWDMAAGAIIIREAGGFVHSLDRNDAFDIEAKSMICGSSLALTKVAIELSAKYNYRAAVLES
ncbi:myo-inositol-1(or 4)-monophosphatase 1, putative [Bodo saltans]|uniref:Inositol-1-monophosphatase n=1 Tax=Bodo saltans TaxID=75058 RepID=A0A0S4J704_BODSA|nr:myo-inositol-1(or 4)-monophosphatase 1, putative [Bodo saltans]|eukprot:CUG85461.1 myo-inositol-1(or 4)-monophosphatase 1, putative [Bodo saltans]